MRPETLIHRSVLAASALLLAACASHETQTPPPHPMGRPGGPGMRPDGQRPGPNGGRPKPPAPKTNLSPDETMNKVDANKDGAISLQEQTDFSVHEADERFSRMDHDHDGRLSSKELADAEKRRQTLKSKGVLPSGGNGARQLPDADTMLTKADTNQDGVIDASENRALARQQATRRFHFGDKNKDGRLEIGELQTKAQMPGQ